MQQSVPRGNKKSTVQPVIITTDTKFTPKISERTIQKRKEAKEKLLNPSKYASGLDLCGVICLYIFLILTVIIGGGGIAVSAVYFNSDSSVQGWKIAGIVLGAVTMIIGAILILLTIFKQARNRPWRYKKTEKIINTDGYDDDDDDEEMNIENLGYDKTHDNIIIHRDSQDDRNNSPSQSTNIEFFSDTKTREIATSPILDPSNPSAHLKTLNDDMIFCPGCNRLHPSKHQCMYSTRIANGFAVPFRTISQPPVHDSIAIQTEDNINTPKRNVPHTVIDRKLKYSNTTETQTNVTAKPSSNITESIILRRVPIPTAKVVVQQPTTKVMIVKVPNTAGQLIIQPKTLSFDEQPK